MDRKEALPWPLHLAFCLLLDFKKNHPLHKNNSLYKKHATGEISSRGVFFVALHQIIKKTIYCSTKKIRIPMPYLSTENGSKEVPFSIVLFWAINSRRRPSAV